MIAYDRGNWWGDTKIWDLEKSFTSLGKEKVWGTISSYLKKMETEKKITIKHYDPYTNISNIKIKIPKLLES